MKTMFPLMCVLLCSVLLCSVNPSNVLADHPAEDPIHSHLFPPELLIHHRVEIGLTEEQVRRIHARLEETGLKVQQQQVRLSQAMQKLSQTLAAAEVNEEVALQQLDDVLAIEKEVKRLHLRLMITIRNELDARQRQVANQLRHRQGGGEDLEQRLMGKVARIEKTAQSLAEIGRPPVELMRMMQRFPELMKKGRIQEAEALLDRVLEALDKMVADDASAKPRRDSSLTNRTNSPPRFDKAFSADSIRSQVAALKKKDVAWRQIEWKTCLLDGLKASRDENKPIMLWVFIDRPIDDERC